MPSCSAELCEARERPWRSDPKIPALASSRSRRLQFARFRRAAGNLSSCAKSISTTSPKTNANRPRGNSTNSSKTFRSRSDARRNRSIWPNAILLILRRSGFRKEKAIARITGTARKRNSISSSRGAGKVRDHHGTTEVSAGDSFIFAPGEAHQLSATENEDFVYYVIADNPRGDTCYYPDSGKWVAFKEGARRGRSRREPKPTTTTAKNSDWTSSLVFVRGAHAPRVLSPAPRRRRLLRAAFGIGAARFGRRLFGEAPKKAREARALPGQASPRCCPPAAMVNNRMASLARAAHCFWRLLVLSPTAARSQKFEGRELVESRSSSPIRQRSCPGQPFTAGLLLKMAPGLAYLLAISRRRRHPDRDQMEPAARLESRPDSMADSAEAERAGRHPDLRLSRRGAAPDAAHAAGENRRTIRSSLPPRPTGSSAKKSAFRVAPTCSSTCRSAASPLPPTTELFAKFRDRLPRPLPPSASAALAVGAVSLTNCD